MPVPTPCPDCGGDCQALLDHFVAIGAGRDLLPCGCARRLVEASDGDHELGCLGGRASAVGLTLIDHSLVARPPLPRQTCSSCFTTTVGTLVSGETRPYKTLVDASARRRWHYCSALACQEALVRYLGLRERLAGEALVRYLGLRERLAGEASARRAEVAR